jgi:hypothetical protein
LEDPDPATERSAATAQTAADQDPALPERTGSR